MGLETVLDEDIHHYRSRWNSAATIENAILSVASQRHPDLEHIIVDGNSSDATLPIVFSSCR